MRFSFVINIYHIFPWSRRRTYCVGKLNFSSFCEMCAMNIKTNKSMCILINVGFPECCIPTNCRLLAYMNHIARTMQSKKKDHIARREKKIQINRWLFNLVNSSRFCDLLTLANCFMPIALSLSIIRGSFIMFVKRLSFIMQVY